LGGTLKLRISKTLEILIKPWKEAMKNAFLVRQEVFIKEQGVPPELEIDEFDASADHALFFQDTQCIGTGRLVNLGDYQAQIGRMAVLAQFRGLGIGKRILETLIALASSREAKAIILHSQVNAISFYEKLGFTTQGPIYIEAGIPHRNMILILQK
jgi:predicted GNAT family N-acyltransferase